MFRDFIYLDIDRIQSIIAQLEEGLLDQIMEGRTGEVSGKIGGSFNFLSLLVPLRASAEAAAKQSTDIRQNKVLHDYAFSLALDLLRDQGFLTEEGFDALPEAGFVLINGYARIFNFETISKVIENWDGIMNFFQPQREEQQGDQEEQRDDHIVKKGKVIIDTYFKDAIRVRVTSPEGTSFIGPLAKEHLREDIHNITFKYGTNPRDEWTMLAEISRIPPPKESLETLPQEQAVQGENPEGQQPIFRNVEAILDSMNQFEEFLTAPSPHEAIVAPLAVFREVHPHFRE